MARFRCCGNYNTDGHAEDCSLKPSTTEAPTKPPKADDEEGCRFDILHFEHIGECKGTCDGEDDTHVQFATQAHPGKVNVILVDLSDATEEDLKDLEERGFKRLTEQELIDLLSEYDAGEIEVEVTTMTLSEMKERYPKRTAKGPNPFLSVKEAAKELQFSESWVRKLCAKGRLAGAMKLGIRWAIPHDAIYMKED